MVTNEIRQALPRPRKKLIGPQTKKTCKCRDILIVDDNNFNILALDLSLKQLAEASPRLRGINLEIDSVRA